MSFYANYPATGGGGGGGGMVPVYSTFVAFPAGTSVGMLAVAADTGNLYEWNGTIWVLIAGPNDVHSLGALDSETVDARGANLVAGILAMQSADATHPGLVNNTTQTFSGNKTFTGTISASNLSGTNTGDVTIGTANGLSIAAGQILSLGLSSVGTTGALSSADWNTFNNKQNTLTLGNLTDAGTDGIVVTNGTGAVVGTGTSLAQHVADTAHNGYLSSTDWNTFNGKQSPLVFNDSLVNTAGTVTLVNDSGAPGNNQFYGTDVAGVRGFYPMSSGSGTVTTVSVVTTNGFAGTVANATTTPAITISTTVTGLLKGNGTSVVAATPGVDYLTSPVGLSDGGTGGTSQQTAIDSLTGTQSAGTYLRSDGTHASLSAIQIGDLPPNRPVTIQTFTAAGTGTYITPSPVVPIYIKIRMIGGGGGGSGSGVSQGSGTVGGDTLFGTSLLTAGGGAAATGGAGGSGGTATVAAGPIGFSINGGTGDAGGVVNTALPMYTQGGGAGAVSAFGGAGGGGTPNTTNGGGGAQPNSGAGGGGASTTSATNNAVAGGGGGAGAYIDVIIVNPAALYTYTVGAGGTGGTAGTGGAVGGAGGRGIIIVEEHY